MSPSGSQGLLFLNSIALETVELLGVEKLVELPWPLPDVLDMVDVHLSLMGYLSQN